MNSEKLIDVRAKASRKIPKDLEARLKYVKVSELMPILCFTSFAR